MEKEFLELLEAGDYAAAAVFVAEKSPETAAALLSEMPEEHIVPFSRELESDFLADILLLLDSGRQRKILDGLRDDELKDVMDEVSVDDT